jgi:hypothetical protein
MGNPHAAAGAIGVAQNLSRSRFAQNPLIQVRHIRDGLVDEVR